MEGQLRQKNLIVLQAYDKTSLKGIAGWGEGAYK